MIIKLTIENLREGEKEFIQSNQMSGSFETGEDNI